LVETIKAHAGEARAAQEAFGRASQEERRSVIAFLDSLRVLPPGTRAIVIDEHNRPRP
jgi:hypothetical protein